MPTIVYGSNESGNRAHFPIKVVISVFYQRFIATLLLLGWSAACHKTVEPVQPDHRGRNVAELPALFTVLGWSADSRELYYLTYIQITTVDTGNFHLYALDVQTGASRLIYDGPGGRNLNTTVSQHNFQSPDGQYLYLVGRERRQTGYSLYRINTRQLNQAVAIDSTSSTYGPGWPVMAVNGNWLSFAYRPDTLRVHNLTTHSSFYLPSASVVAFSPDASQALLRQGTGYQRMTLSDLSRTPVDLTIPTSQLNLPDIPQYPTEIRWNSQGICYVYGEFFGTGSTQATIHKYLWNATLQKSTEFYAVPDGESGASQPVWSRDGERIAFTSSNNALFRERLNNAILYSTNLSTLKTSQVATVTFNDGDKLPSSSGGIRGLFISPDNTTLAYYVGYRIYVAPIQP